MRVLRERSSAGLTFSKDARPGGPAPVDAATVVLIRAGASGLEVLLTRRPETMSFAPGRHVFPGGSVHEADLEPIVASHSRLTPGEATARLGGDVAPARALAFHVAALRELFEETGLLLAGGAAVVDPARRDHVTGGRRTFAEVLQDPSLRDRTLGTDALLPIARWVTPRFLDRRFDTWFFAAVVDPAVELSFDRREIADAEWIRPADALAAMAGGRLRMWLPTSTTLQRLAEIGDPSDLPSLAAGRPLRPRSKRLAGDVVQLHFGTAGGVPGREANGYLIGRSSLVIVDPGDPSESALDMVLAIARDAGAVLAAIVLTGADVGRVAGCEALRGELGLPVFGPAGSGRYVPFEVFELEDGATVPAGDVPLSLRVAGVGRSRRIELAAGDRTILVPDWQDQPRGPWRQPSGGPGMVQLPGAAGGRSGHERVTDG